MAIGKEGTRDNYVGTIWEGVRMVNNVAKKGFTIDIQTREGLEHLKNRYITETRDIKEELRADREVKKILDQ